MRPVHALALMPLLLAGCGRTDSVSGPPEKLSLAQARQAFRSTLVRAESTKQPLPTPPAKLFRLVRYDAPVGKLGAYVSPDPGDGKKHPAIIWITGGDCNSIDDGCWKEGPPENDQSASAFRKAGIVMMFPSLRGGSDNPGYKESFYGEVDDVLAAADWLMQQPYVDAKRIYLGGHSTGGTLALLTAEVSGRFRAVFSFGPVGDIAGYGPEFMPYDTRNPREGQLRAPARWLQCVESPTFVFEGTQRGNLAELERMKSMSTNLKLHFHPVKGADHFSILAPVTKLITVRIRWDEGETSNIMFKDEELAQLFGK